MRRLRRILLWLASLLVVVVGVTAAGLVWLVGRSHPTVSGTAVVAELDGEVEVRRDAWGVPHIWASSDADLVRAQGYVHAQDRFWQMDFWRHISAGRTAELFGEDQLEADRFIRTLGWRRAAERDWEVLSSSTQEALEHYAEGVNAYIDGRSPTQLSFEYAVLATQARGYEVEPWTPIDSLSWLQVMAWDLGGNRLGEIEQAVLSLEAADLPLADLYPPYPDDRHPDIVEHGGVVDSEFRPDADLVAAATAGRAVTPLPAEALPPLRRVWDRMLDLGGILGPIGEGIGSNSWAVAGARTASGLPLLANDPHLGPQMPSIWYEVGLHCVERTVACSLDVAGFSFAGVPGVVIGHNDRIAWGFTNLGPDVQDHYLERVEGDTYAVGTAMVPMDVIEEEIRVAGGGSEVHRIRSTRNGPILSDVSESLAELASATAPAGEEYAVSFRWSALDEPSRTADAILGFNRATDLASFREAARSFDVPAQNLLYADVDGHIAYQAPGRIPVRARKADIAQGVGPFPGWDDDYQWIGAIPFEQLPWVLDPPEGYIVTANQRVIDPAGYPHLILDDSMWSMGYRAQAIVERIEEAGDGLTVADMQAIQRDNRNLSARDLRPVVLAVDVEGAGARVHGLIEAWEDVRQDADSVGAAAWNAFWRHLYDGLFVDQLPEDRVPYAGSRSFEIVRLLVDDPTSAWWDDTRTSAVEDRDALIASALAAAEAELVALLGEDESAWTWGDLHTLTARNQSFGLSGVGPLESIFNRGPIRTGGGTSIVNATGWTPPSYEVDWVPSMRMVVDLADLDATATMHLTGQSGHAYHEHYDDMLEPWARGRFKPFPSSDLATEAVTVDRLRLVPGG